MNIMNSESSDETHMGDIGKNTSNVRPEIDHSFNV
jgi:hypothetical protein